MPQITVTLDEMTYMDLVHNLPKGMKSAFVNRAVKDMIAFCCGYGSAMHKYAREGQYAASMKVKQEHSMRDKHQKSLEYWEEKNLASLQKNRGEEE